MFPSPLPFLLVLLFSISLSSSSSSANAKTVATLPSRPKQKVIPATTAAASISTTHRRRREAAWVSGVKNFAASGMAAACSKLILAPFDTIKTIQQHSRSSGAAATTGAALSIAQAARVIMSRPNGFLEFYAGIGVAVVGSMPSVGLYFGVYSFCKRRLEDMNPDHQTLNIAMSAAIGNTIASAARVPYEVMKQKLQTGAYSSMGEALRDMSLSTIFPTGGIASQMLRDIPYAVITLLCYEHFKTVWKPRAQRKYPTVPTRSWDLVVGGTSGGVGSFLTNPFDVIKTRLQTSSSEYGGSIRTCISTTWKEGGPSAFLRGSVPRLLHKVPANAFFFLFYECFRTLLRVQDDDTSTVAAVDSGNNKNNKSQKMKTANKGSR